MFVTLWHVVWEQCISILCYDTPKLSANVSKKSTTTADPVKCERCSGNSSIVVNVAEQTRAVLASRAKICNLLANGGRGVFDQVRPHWGHKYIAWWAFYNRYALDCVGLRSCLYFGEWWNCATEIVADCYLPAYISYFFWGVLQIDTVIIDRSWINCLITFDYSCFVFEC